ncbi:guanylate kinase [Lentilactobacillus parafarraginis]|jgi:guanylate kinase|uniref:Guanylate kinase n=2 Tax=Lentilactobacillus parafarraginis TaxID=390842 RepID=A0A0R1YX79_9LACO|nr:AAA family ATPase [Lentilactobacillus parafarraginis]KRM44331.1 guanylate kinase [Lentilactobacillus parafarraginis DSM 18390 = JCM 14109]TLQ18507.1 guanylate kinase [Lentilactobacillus parafarraginis]
MKNRVFVITGAAGSGKTTVRNYLHERYGMPRVITHTTRPARENEVNGVDYYFETETSFFKRHYLESVTYAGHHYGSSYEGLQSAWHKNPDATIVLDGAGAVTYKQKLGDQAVIIFLRVGNPDELVRRMQTRGDDTTMVAKRVKSQEYARDLQMPRQLVGRAYEIVNTDLAQTKAKIDQIVAKYVD